MPNPLVLSLVTILVITAAVGLIVGASKLIDKNPATAVVVVASAMGATIGYLIGLFATLITNTIIGGPTMPTDQFFSYSFWVSMPLAVVGATALGLYVSRDTQ